MKMARPLRAIRLKCYDCSGWNWNEVGKCPHKSCILYPLRYGKKPKNTDYATITGQEYMSSIEKCTTVQS